MQVGQVYMCEGCGLELQVVKACADGTAEGKASCPNCEIICCSEPLKLKQ
jgi:hypothetical protein